MGAIRSNYEKQNFTGAILDAFYFLSELLRNKSGLEGDGASLIGQALGGATPKIKLNRLQTESERNVQRGMEQLLRGFYQAVRNPRSHDKFTDSEDEAQALILFVGYLVKQLDQAKAQFSRLDFIPRVLDSDFVPQPRYAELLVDNIPSRERMEVFLDLFYIKEDWNTDNMRYFLEALLNKFSEDEIDQVCEILSEELNTCNSDKAIQAILYSFPPEIWPKIGEAARLRIENKLIRSIRNGEIEDNIDSNKGYIGKFSINIFSEITLKEEMIKVIANKIEFGSSASREYVLRHLFGSLYLLSDAVPPSISEALVDRLKNRDERVYAALCFVQPWNENTWPENLKSAYDAFEETEPDKGHDDEVVHFER